MDKKRTIITSQTIENFRPMQEMMRPLRVNKSHMQIKGDNIWIL